MRDIDAAFMQQILDVPKRQRLTDIHHHREADDLGRGLEIPENAGVAHAIEGSRADPGGNPMFV
jgi:hypothetical protein